MAPHETSAAKRLSQIESQLKLSEKQKVPSKAPLRTIFPPLVLEEHPIDEYPPIKTIVVGAGIGGITAGILLPAKVPGLQLTILEKNSEVGGVWHTNIYPGVRCDVPANVYQSTFESSTKWSEAYATGPEIKAYWLGVVEKYDVRKYIQFNSQVTRAVWSEEKGKWIVDIVTAGEKRVEETDFLITATGHFSHPRLPDYPGIKDFKGHLRHSSNWDPDFDPKGKVVAVIGNGASGLQVVPPLQKITKKLYHFARSRTWIAGSLAGEELSRDTNDPDTVAPQDPDEYLKFRKNLENPFYKRFGSMFKNHERNNAARKQFEELMGARLGDRKDLLDAIKPDFSPSCRRLTPGPGYLEAITEDNVEYVPEHILRFTETGIETIDGKHRELDAVICSTGADISFSTAFPIWSNGIDLQASWRPGGSPGFPDPYLGIGAPNFPNLLFLLGPNSAGQSATLPNSVENQLTYIAKVLRKVSSNGIRTIAPSRKATDDFRAYCESFFPRTVLSENCSSWFNGGIVGGRIHGVWPGSGIHVNIARREVRWEDFDYTYKSQSGNRFAYFGNGWSKRDVLAAEDPSADIDFTPYLSKKSVLGQVDLRAHHEAWFDI